MKVLVSKNSECIVISKGCKKMRICNEEKLFDELKDLTKEEIIEWYLNR